MARIDALQKLPWLPSFFIFLLFLAIETSPILAKLLAAKGEYDLKLEEAETSLATWVNQQVAQRKLLTQTEGDINQQVYEDLKQEEAVFNHKKSKIATLLKLQTDAFVNGQTKQL